MKKLVVFMNGELDTFDNRTKPFMGVVHLDDHPDSFSDESLKQAAISLLHKKFFGIPATDIKRAYFNQISTLTSYETEE
jgi:hypothetical protein